MKNIVILYGELPQNANKDDMDTLAQVKAISEALRDAGYSVTPVMLSLNLQAAKDRLREIQPDLVFNLVESVAGHGRLIYLGTALLDALKIPYTGVHTDAMFITSNKLLAKQRFQAANIPTPLWFTREQLRSGAQIPPERYIMKSVWEHASIGLSEASIRQTNQADELWQALEQQQAELGGEGFAETYIDGREFNLSLLADSDGTPTVLPIAEIVFQGYDNGKAKIVDYLAKWEESSFEYVNTVRAFDTLAEDDPLNRRLQIIALDCWYAFGLRGYARVDFRVSDAGEPFVLEVNANPCLSPDAGFAAAAARAGITYRETLVSIIAAGFLNE